MQAPATTSPWTGIRGCPMRLATFGTFSNSALSIGAGALTQSPDYSYLALPLAKASGVFWLVLLAVFMFHQRREIWVFMHSWLFIVGCYVVAFIAVGGGSYALGTRTLADISAEKQTAAPSLSVIAQEQFLKDAVLADWSDNPKEPLIFLGTPTLTTDRLRVVVEYSIYRNGWMSRVRFEVDPIKEPIKGQRVKVPVAHVGTKQNGGMEDLWWGTDPHSANLVTNNPIYASGPASLTRGRVVIIGPNNKEQNAVYFEIVRAPNDATGNLKFMVLQGREVGDWISDWEKDG
jgi:hypothetical protein